jgi:hypothetical protein
MVSLATPVLLEQLPSVVRPVLVENSRDLISWDSHGVVSLYDMMELYAYFFVQQSNQLAAWEKALGETADSQMWPKAVAQLFAEVGTFGVLCAAHGFKITAQQCSRIHEELRPRVKLVKCGDVRVSLKELRQRFEDELREVPFFQLSSQELEMYRHPAKTWERVTERFRETRIDIEECSKCFVFGRYAASLFHVLLVAEYGVIALAKLLSVAGDKPGWGALDRLEKISAKPYRDRTPLEQKYSKVLDSIMPFALSMKNEWRHKISHVENRLVWQDSDFSPQMAKDIIGAVRGFMDKLVTELPE